MKKLIARGAKVFAVGAVAASFAMLGAGAAAADPLIGKTYGDASGTVSDWGATPVIATQTGDQLSTDQCIVSSWSRSSSVDALTGRDSRDVLMHLNCNAKVAEPGQPGNSVATPQGKQAKQDINQAKQDINRANTINKDPDRCYESDDNLTYCKRICERTGLCEIE